MAVRNESVRLSLQDDFTSGMAKATAATLAFGQALDSIDGSNVRVGNGLSQTARDVDGLSVSTRRAGADIDQFSGRLRLFADAAITLGPALIPVGAVAVPAVTGLAAAFGFAATGAATAIVAFQGVGTALDAVNKAQLEPTAENLEAARQAMQEIAPAARDFVRELDQMGPAFEAIRDAGAAGLFPGLVDGLNKIEPALPRIAGLFEKVGTAVGGLVSDGAESLAGPKWEEFIDFMGVEAPRALTEMGHTLGDVAHGMAELWMAFTPLNRDFSGWLRDSARGFDEWATGLSQTQGFQEFIDYIRANGPKVAEAMGAIGNALLQVVEAASPLGGPVLQVITQFANVIADLANSDIGTPLFATAAALTALSRAGSLLGVQATGMAGFLGSLRQLALVGSLVGAVKGIQLLDGALQDLFDRNFDDSKLSESVSALASGRVPDDLEKMTGHLKNLDAAFLGLQDKAFGWLPGSTAVEEATDEIGKLDEELAGLVESGHAEDAAAAFSTILSEAEKAGVSADSVREAFSQYFAALDNATPRGAGLQEFFSQGAEAADDMAGSVRSLSDALAGLSGWLDKREALRGFKDAMAELGKSIDSGKSGQWAANIDAVGRSIVQMASTLKGGARFKFIDDAISGLEKMAKGAGPKAQAQIQALIAQLEKLAGANPKPKIGADDGEFKNKVSASERRMRALAALEAHPGLSLNDKAFQKAFGLTKADLAFLSAYTATPSALLQGNALAQINATQAAMNAINGQRSTVYINTVRTVQDVGAGRPQVGGVTKADGGYISGPGTATSDSIPAWLSNGEYVVRAAAVEKYGTGFLNQLNAMRFADGGLVSHTFAKGYADGGEVGPGFGRGLGDAARDSATGLRALNRQLRISEKAVERERKQREAIVSRQDAIRSGISDSFLSDPFGNLGSNVWASGGGGNLIDTLLNDLNGVRSFNKLLKGLGGKGKRGIDGAALEFLAQSGNLEGLQALQAMSPADRERWERLFEQRAREVRGVGNRAANQVLGAALARETRELKAANRRLQRIEQAIKDEGKKDRDNRDKNTNKRDKGAGNARRRARA